MPSLRLFSGRANAPLAGAISDYLGVPLGKVTIDPFPDGELFVRLDEDVRGKDVFIIQPTSTPANETLMELLIFIDSARRASAERITAVVPYFGYARQDRKDEGRTPITAKLAANLIATAGADRVLTMDLHAAQIQGFFDIPVDNLFATPVLLPYIRDHLSDNVVLVAPDAGGVERTLAFAKRLDRPMAIIDKRRDAPNVSRSMNILGEVEGCRAVVVDDIVDTAGTLVQGAEALHKAGAKEVYACCTHPVLSGPALERLQGSHLTELIVTNSIPLSEEARGCGKIRSFSIARLLAEGIKRTYFSESVSGLFI